jgi:hypothetical protein
MKKLITLLTLVFCFNCYSQQKWEYAQYLPYVHKGLDIRVMFLQMPDTFIHTPINTKSNEAENADIKKFKEQCNTKLKGYIKLTGKHSGSDSSIMSWLGMNGWELVTVNRIKDDTGVGNYYYFKRQVK